MKVLAGFKGGVCVAVRRSTHDDERFAAMIVHRGLDKRICSIDDCIKAASPGFKKSVRMLKQSMAEEAKIKEVLE